MLTKINFNFILELFELLVADALQQCVHFWASVFLNFRRVANAWWLDIYCFNKILSFCLLVMNSLLGIFFLAGILLKAQGVEVGILSLFVQSGVHTIFKVIFNYSLARILSDQTWTLNYVWIIRQYFFYLFVSLILLESDVCELVPDNAFPFLNLHDLVFFRNHWA
jgi:hypothetical protein